MEEVFMEKKHFSTVVLIPLVILTFLVCFIVYGVFSSKQDILIQTDSTQGYIYINDKKLAQHAVCVPEVQRGEHIVRMQDTNETLEATIFVADNTVIHRQGTISPKDNTYPFVYTQGDLTLTIEPTDCRTWTFGKE
jgi:hypothetical protein